MHEMTGDDEGAQAEALMARRAEMLRAEVARARARLGSHALLLASRLRQTGEHPADADDAVTSED